MRTSTNLAQRPFRNERPEWLFASVLLILALGASALQVRFASRLLSGDEARTVKTVREEEARIASLEELIAKEPPQKIETAEIERLRAIKSLVDRRVFPWRRLIAELEATLSADVHLNTIAPTAKRGGPGVLVVLSGSARTKDAAFTLAETLDKSDAFSGAVLRALTEDKDEVHFDLEVTFDPGGLSRATTAGAPQGGNAP